MRVTLRFGEPSPTWRTLSRPAPIAFVSSAELVRAAVRHAVAEEIERLVGILDTLDGDPDAEPSLGWPEGVAFRDPLPTDDREDDAGDDREPDEDREPLLGWSESENQPDEGPERFGDVWACDEEEESRQSAATPSPRPEDEP